MKEEMKKEIINERINNERIRKISEENTSGLCNEK